LNKAFAELRRKKLPEQEDKELRRRAIWSGTVSFGLVSIPVAILPGQRSQRVRMRLLSPDGIPLARKYYCPAENRPIERENIIRGYEIEKGKFIIVTDHELDSLQPSKSREIDLRRFVPADQIDPKFLDRSYFLIPVGDSLKPYRLLAETMEKSGKVGIATFVMRDREYLVAILAKDGVLMAETLRFVEEVRTPESVGIAKNKAINASRINAMVDEIRAVTADQLDMQELEDDYSRRLLELANQKIAKRQDMVSLPEVKNQSGNPDNVIDLMQVLKRSMEKESIENKKKEKSNDNSLESKSRSYLYNKAKDLQIPGRSRMNRLELIKAIYNFL
jgi:DNA end-binding protein Ku